MKRFIRISETIYNIDKIICISKKDDLKKFPKKPYVMEIIFGSPGLNEWLGSLAYASERSRNIAFNKTYKELLNDRLLR